MGSKARNALKIAQIKFTIKDIFSKNPNKTFNYKQISVLLKIVKKKERQVVQQQLDELVAEGFLSEVIIGRYKSFSRKDNVVGKVDMTAWGAAFVIPENGGEDIFVSQSNLKHALNGDIVKVLPFTHRKNYRLEGEVVGIIKRKRDLFVGIIEISETSATLVTDSKIIDRDVIIPLDKIKDAENGQKVVVKIVEWNNKDKTLQGEVVDVLGNHGEHDVEMHAILAEFNLPYSYPEKYVTEAEKISDIITDEEISTRKDFREITTFTIDPADAKDFDDALSIRKLENGLWEIGIHIADVTHYVQPDSIIDKEAFNRATSVYLVDRVVPMLPERLSNYLCSAKSQISRVNCRAPQLRFLALQVKNAE